MSSSEDEVTTAPPPRAVGEHSDSPAWELSVGTLMGHQTPGLRTGLGTQMQPWGFWLREGLWCQAPHTGARLSPGWVCQGLTGLCSQEPGSNGL